MSDYRDRFPNFAISDEGDGVTVLRMHTDGGPLVFTGDVHRDLVDVFYEISRDRRVRVLVFTATGDSWIDAMDGGSFGDFTRPDVWDTTYWEGRKLLHNLLDIEVPVIAAVNGPAHIHSELILTCDVILASRSATFQDVPHLAGHVAPGDGMHVLWPRAIGMVRGRYFLLTRQCLDAATARDWGAINEVLDGPELMPRAFEIARDLARLPTLTLRYTRALFTQPLRRELVEDLGAGLALEGLTAAAQRG